MPSPSHHIANDKTSARAIWSKSHSENMQHLPHMLRGFSLGLCILGLLAVPGWDPFWKCTRIIFVHRFSTTYLCTVYTTWIENPNSNEAYATTKATTRNRRRGNESQKRERERERRRWRRTHKKSKKYEQTVAQPTTSSSLLPSSKKRKWKMEQKTRNEKITCTEINRIDCKHMRIHGTTIKHLCNRAPSVSLERTVAASGRTSAHEYRTERTNDVNVVCRIYRMEQQ